MKIPGSGSQVARRAAGRFGMRAAYRASVAHTDALRSLAIGRGGSHTPTRRVLSGFDATAGPIAPASSGPGASGSRSAAARLVHRSQTKGWTRLMEMCSNAHYVPGMLLTKRLVSASLYTLREYPKSLA